MDLLGSMFNGFPFKSKEQMDRERKDFEKRVFPLGMEQRDAADRVLTDLLPKVKHKSDRLYAFIAAKDAYVRDVEEDPARALAKAREAMQSLHWRGNDNERMVMALILLERNTPSLEVYPTAEMVRAEAQRMAWD